MTKVYQTNQIRNLALLGHSGSGKTSLVEAMLHNTGATTRLGRVEDGNTVSDYDDEEIRRTISINASVLPVEWDKHKLNVIDSPGYLDFIGEIISSLSAVEVAVLVIDGASGVEVGSILAWKNARAANIPCVIFVNKMNREYASYRRVLDDLGSRFDATFVPMQVPIRDGEVFKGVVDLLTLRARTGQEGIDDNIPDNMAAEVEEFRVEMIEAAVEGDDDLMMKYFEGEELTLEELATGLQLGLERGEKVPVFCGSATDNVGIRTFMNSIVSMFPAPHAETTVFKGEEEISMPLKDDGPLVIQVFKTVDDQYGSVSYFKVLSGIAKSDTRLFNTRAEAEERIGHLFLPRGKEQLPVDNVVAGDIGAVVKLSHTVTGDTLCEKGQDYKVLPSVYPNPLYAVAIHPKTQADTGKLGPTLERLTSSDPTLKRRDERSTRQLLLEGMGEAHIDVAVRRMADKYGLHVETTTPKIPYQESITKAASARYRHKKQTGGAGQFGEVELRVEPLERGNEFTFESEVFGGAISSVFLPSIEKGIKQVLNGGIMAGSPVVDLKAVVVDGKEHPVDSKDIAFQIAGRESFKQAFMAANPVLLEPIMELRVTVPDNYTGDVISDLTTKRGQVQGMEQLRGDTIITAIAPLAEIQRYSTDLRSITQGRGLYEQELSHYQQVPSHLMQGIIDAYNKEQEEE